MRFAAYTIALATALATTTTAIELDMDTTAAVDLDTTAAVDLDTTADLNMWHSDGELNLERNWQTKCKSKIAEFKDANDKLY